MLAVKVFHHANSCLQAGQDLEDPLLGGLVPGMSLWTLSVGMCMYHHNVSAGFLQSKHMREKKAEAMIPFMTQPSLPRCPYWFHESQKSMTIWITLQAGTVAQLLSHQDTNIHMFSHSNIHIKDMAF